MVATLVRGLMALIVAVATVAGAEAASQQQEIVDKAALTVEKMLADPGLPTLNRLMRKARGVLVVPSLIKGGFVFGVEGGSGVLVARDGAGRWGYPAFYTVGGGSFGLQAGVQDAEVMFVIMTDSGLKAMMSKRFKLGADASIAVGPAGGAGVEGATTASLGADIYAFAATRGVFAGASFEGTAVIPRASWNRAYYGPGATARAIVLDGRFANKGADRLRRALAGTGKQSTARGRRFPVDKAAPPRPAKTLGGQAKKGT